MNKENGIKFSNMVLDEAPVDSESVFSGELLNVFRDKVSLPDGKITTREYIKHLGAVCIVALDDDNNVVVEQQFRYPFHKVVLEIPAGKLDFADEDPLLAAQRELREETGISAKDYTYIGPLYPSVAYTTEVIHMYMAKGLSFGDRELDDTERINFSFVPLKDFVQMIIDGDVPDAKTQAAILKVWTMLQNQVR